MEARRPACRCVWLSPLLADRNGVIDLICPSAACSTTQAIQPGGVILKVIGNLVMKAVTAPFSCFAGMFGAADDMGVVHFVRGSSALDDRRTSCWTKLPSS